jgi:ABC-type molybdenum transport system ATPase subunit/photorepair protein PhrA
MDLIHVLSPNLTPHEEDVIKLHKEIKERVETYEKVNRKLGWGVEEVNEQVEEQSAIHDKMISKYTNIFSNMEKKLSEMETTKRQTTKHKEDIIREKLDDMKSEIHKKSKDGTNFMQKNISTIQEVTSASNIFIDNVALQYEYKENGK